MEPQPRELQIYFTAEGKAPYTEWLESLQDLGAVAQVERRLARIRVGLLGDCKALGEGVHELRIDVGPGYRIYFGQIGKDIVLLLCGGEKGSQAADIKKAKKYWADYKKRTR